MSLFGYSLKTSINTEGYINKLHISMISIVHTELVGKNLKISKNLRESALRHDGITGLGRYNAIAKARAVLHVIANCPAMI